MLIWKKGRGANNFENWQAREGSLGKYSGIMKKGYLFLFGFYRIRETFVETRIGDDEKYDKVEHKDRSDEPERPGVIVSKHVSYIDILYHMSVSYPSFVAKRESKSSDFKGVSDQPEKIVPKEKSEYTAEDISSIAKDAKVRHLLHSAIDNVMSNRVINCKTAKEIWDALETRCQGTDAIKKNMRTILTQEYEHFESKPDESLTALPESWDLKATTIRDNYALDETTLDEIYGMLKTHELEMVQRSKRHGRKSRRVALQAEEESPKVAVSKKGK
ncbi:hypothetical protein AgCh_008076 [Apium graveolens]